MTFLLMVDRQFSTIDLVCPNLQRNFNPRKDKPPSS
jgi:hypothetical protein